MAAQEHSTARGCVTHHAAAAAAAAAARGPGMWGSTCGCSWTAAQQACGAARLLSTRLLPHAAAAYRYEAAGGEDLGATRMAARMADDSAPALAAQGRLADDGSRTAMAVRQDPGRRRLKDGRHGRHATALAWGTGTPCCHGSMVPHAAMAAFYSFALHHVHGFATCTTARAREEEVAGGREEGKSDCTCTTDHVPCTMWRVQYD
jgi:hypothetical protein